MGLPRETTFFDVFSHFKTLSQRQAANKNGAMYVGAPFCRHPSYRKTV
jgi:hypothetical protein